MCGAPGILLVGFGIWIIFGLGLLANAFGAADWLARRQEIPVVGSQPTRFALGPVAMWRALGGGLAILPVVIVAVSFCGALR